MKNWYIILELCVVLLIACLSGCTQPLPTENKENNVESDNNDNEKDTNLYQWSQMNEGPYKDKISFATSTDLLNWTDSQRILAEHASVPGAVYKNGIIYVYFVDVSENGKPEQIGLIRSEDNGQTWSPKEYVSFEGIGEKVPVDPAPLLLDDGRIRLYYFDINEGRSSHSPPGTNKIYSAISTDGRHFIQEDGIRFEKEAIFDPDVVCVGNTWYLYVGYIMSNQILSAISTDGLTFTEKGPAYHGGTVPDVFYHNGTYYLYTIGIDISTSQDGLWFTKTSSRFQSNVGTVTADASVIQLNDGTYLMLYKTR
ncbi:MAG: hypothetical protein QXX20_07345 [Candidatus Thermoplasmatota archaeon]